MVAINRIILRNFLILIILGLSCHDMVGQIVPFTFLKTGVPVQRAAKSFYFSKLGNDNNSGTDSSNTWLTLYRLQYTLIIPGDTLKFRSGDTISGSYTFQNVAFVDTSKKILMTTYRPGKARIHLDSSLTFSFKFNFTGVVKVEIKNLIFEGKYNAYTQLGGGVNSGAIVFYNTTSSPYELSTSTDSMYINIDSCEFSRFWGSAINMQISSKFKKGIYRIQSSYFHDIGDKAIYIGGIMYSDFKVVNNKVVNIYGRTDGEYSGTAMSFLWCKSVIVERNYVNNSGLYASIGGAGIYFTDTRKSIVRYNEVRNVYKNSNEGTGIFFDCGSDSNVVEYNYIQNAQGTGIGLANAPSSFCGYPSNYGEDTLESSFNIARFNIVMVDSGAGAGISMYAGYPSNTTFQKRNMVYNNLVHIKRGRGIGDSNSVYVPAAIWQYGRSDSLYIYNNIFICDSAMAIQSDTNAFAINWTVKNNIYWRTIDTLNTSFGRTKKNSYFYADPIFYWYYRLYTTIGGWADSTGFEKTGVSYNYINANPKINNVLMRIYGTSAEIGAYHLDTLTSFKVSSLSPAKNAGANYDAQVTRIATVATTDFYGNTYNNDIGIYENP